MSKHTGKYGINNKGIIKQQGNKNDWKQQAFLNINTECKLPQT
jgi:hypothetical protein